MGYASSLVNHIRTNVPTATTRDVIGGKYIQPLTQPYTPSSNLSYQTPNTMPDTWTDVPNDRRTTLRVQMDGIDETFYGDDIYGHRLSIVYNSSPAPVLYLDGVAQATGAANANTISYTVQFPFCFAGPAPPSPHCTAPGLTDRFTFQNVVEARPGYTYAIAAGWGFTGRGTAAFSRRLLQESRA